MIYYGPNYLPSYSIILYPILMYVALMVDEVGPLQNPQLYASSMKQLES